MAYLDQGKAQSQKEAKEKYEELKKLLNSKDKNGKLHEYYPALRHLSYLENKIKEQEEKIKEYQGFFILFKKLLPRTSSIHDPIG